MAIFARDFTFFDSPNLGNVSCESSMGAWRDMRLSMPPRPCFDGETGGLGVGKGTSATSCWKMDMFGCSSFTRPTTSVLEAVSSSEPSPDVPERGFNMLLNFDNIVDNWVFVARASLLIIFLQYYEMNNRRITGRNLVLRFQGLARGWFGSRELMRCVSSGKFGGKGDDESSILAPYVQ